MSPQINKTLECPAPRIRERFEILTLKEKSFALLLLVILSLLLFTAFDFSGDYAINDDWGYSTPIRWWAESGQFALTQWQSMPLVTQLVAGAAWTEVFGFSQGTLRQLTLVFAVTTCAAVFACARQLQMPFALCLLCAVLPLASPIFVGLSYSFMADIPAAALVMLSLLFFLRSFNKGTDGGLDYGLGVVFLLLAVLLRQTSIAVAIALVIAEPVARGVSLHRMLRNLGVLVGTVLVYVMFTKTLEGTVGLPRLYDVKTDSLLIFLGDLLAANFGALLFSVKALLTALALFGLFALPLLPILCAALWQNDRNYVWFAAGGAVLLTAASLGLGIGILADAGGNAITGDGLGPRLLKGASTVHPLLVGAVTAIGHFGCLCAVLAALSSTRQDNSWVHDKPLRGSLLLLVLTAVVTFGPHMAVYSAVFDRYTLLPSILLAMAVLRIVSFSGFSPGLGTISTGLGCLGLAISLTLAADFFRWQDTRYALIDQLVSTGIDPQEIDGGFEYNNLLAILDHPDSAISMPALMGIERPVTLKHTPAPTDEIIAQAPYERFFGLATGVIYAVR